MRALATLVCLLAACGAKKERPQGDAARARAIDGGVVVSLDARRTAEPWDAEARALLERWRAAQDAGDLAAYSELYHPAFEGIRRSGKQTKQLDRAGWLKDRTKMFGKPMTVEVADLVVERAGEEIELRFTQTWTSGTYRDRGPKVVRLARDQEDWRIHREELLSSERLPIEPADAGVAAAIPPTATGPATLTFGLSAAADPKGLELALVDEDEVLVARSDVDFASGPLEVVDKLEGLRNGGVDALWVHRAISQVPPVLATAVGLEVAVLDDKLAVACTGTLGDPVALERASTVSWAEKLEDSAPEAWKDGPYVVRVELEAPCEGAFVRAAALPSLDVRKPDKKAAKALAKEIKGDVRARYKGIEVDVQVVADPTGALWSGATYEVDQECHSSQGLHFELTGTTRSLGDQENDARLLAAVDLGGDGVVDLVTTRGVVRVLDRPALDTWRPDFTTSFREQGCDGYEGD